MRGVNFQFSSAFAAKLTAFVEEKQALGYNYVGQARRLRDFDKAMVAAGVCSDTLTCEVATLWTAPRNGEKSSNQLGRISILRVFASFLLQHGEDVYMCPYPHQKDIQVYQPYIFTKDEISRIFKAADSVQFNNRSPYRHLTTPVIVKTLYGAGTRISETLCIKRKDVDLAQKCILVRETKCGKERLLPLSDSLAKVYEEYFKVTSFSQDSYVFVKKSGNHMNKADFYYAFRQLLERAGIPHRGRGSGPRVHDMRHTMAVHRLNQWAVEKKDINVMLPILAVYLGHENVRISSYYLRLTAQVFPELTAQFEHDFGETIPDIIAKELEALREYD